MEEKTVCLINGNDYEQLKYFILNVGKTNKVGVVPIVNKKRCKPLSATR